MRTLPPFEVVIAARDEARTVAAVVRAARAARGVGKVIVADDGSVDGTADAARAAGAHVVTARPAGEPGHKGQALARGVAATTAPVLVFFDADLHGVEPEHIEALVEPLEAGHADLSCGLLSYGPLRDPLFLRLPPITGLRAIRRDLFDRVVLNGRRGFQIEILINEAAVRGGSATAIRLLRGLEHPSKVAKVGWRRGLPATIAMWRDLLDCLRFVPLWTYAAYLRRLTIFPPAGPPTGAGASVRRKPSSDSLARP